jgi:hypothetical protein
MNHKPGPSLSISEIEVRKILTAVWEAVARTNPMLLAKLRADYDFNSLKAMIRDCLEKACQLRMFAATSSKSWSPRPLQTASPTTSVTLKVGRSNNPHNNICCS